MTLPAELQPIPAPIDLLAEELPRGAEIPADLDPLADGILMQHQIEWLEDKSDLKLAEKGRRTGITFAEALDDTLIAATKRSDGGDNVFYIGDTKDKGREFIGYVAHFARVVAGELVEIEEFMFKDRLADGSTNDISAYRVTFGSGYRVEALSSRPENIRGLQGTVVIDEAAFHPDVRGVIDAVNALLIWGGKIRVISTHNGVKNAFNELIREAKAGKNSFSLHYTPFDTAVENGLYERVCLVRGWEVTAEGKQTWLDKIRGSYGTRQEAMRQELDCIPAEGEGSFLSRVLIEACMVPDIPVLRWVITPELAAAPKELRKRETLDWCNKNLLPLLEKLNPKLTSYFGEDFGEKADMTALNVGQVCQNLVRRTAFILELRTAPHEVQRDVVFYIIERLPRFVSGAMDARGNGSYLAQVTRERFGKRMIEVMLSQSWYRENMEPYRSAFEDKMILLPADADVLSDHQAIQITNGIAKVPDGTSGEGADGYARHGDTAIACALAYFASRQSFAPIDFHSTGARESGAFTERTTITDRGFGTVGGGADFGGY